MEVDTGAKMFDPRAGDEILTGVPLVTEPLIGTEPDVLATHSWVLFAWSWLQVSWLG